ncbi:3'-5' exoribonuclease YhaM family protein [Lactobacillus gigeriorum]|uniref:CMP-binding-factor 1 n=1 Tax=Lactobacillus gigeriorum DSM 23908 = CRBIP 24.85 TaxID=1423751 RepID=I7J2U4_9LACO|nr:HD domain-containing protein [Lactobacillus gigeriorum]KRN12818.1 CMP-binding-factor 1 [Lactobacillus gigeriorum DSM 23908 = CRBIP 24.85]CCI87092.1 CMP-binding-factor 1 [Lactobacillus gigeriorum DSM 23908 = CRBIP 24.85]
MLKHLNDYNDGEEINTVAMIDTSQLRRDKNNRFFLNLQFSDRSGKISGIYWQASEEDQLKYSAGSIVELNGKRITYQGHPQVKVYAMRVVSDNDGYDLAEFVTSAPQNGNSLREDIEQYLFEIVNPTWNRIVRYLLKKYNQEFFDFPAGKSNHHAVRGGLAFHTLTMLKVAKSLTDIYPQTNISLLFAGCILHDMGKVIELSGPVATRYTPAGNLIGHLVLIDEQIMLAAKELQLSLDSEDVLLLRHMVLSHHGKLEYGSPKLPQLLEAELLHRIDDLDASVYAITQALNETKPGTFTNPLMSQEGRRFYRPNSASK